MLADDADKVPAVKISLQTVRQTAALDHFRTVSSSHDVFSLPAGAFDLTPLLDALQHRPRKRQRVCFGSEIIQSDLPDDDDMPIESASQPDQRVYFRLVSLKRCSEGELAVP